MAIRKTACKYRSACGTKDLFKINELESTWFQRTQKAIAGSDTGNISIRPLLRPLFFGTLGAGAIKNDIAAVYAMLLIAGYQRSPGPLGHCDINNLFTDLTAQMIVRLKVSVKPVGRVGDMQFSDHAGFAKLVKVTINRRQTQTGVLALKRPINSLCRRVLVSVPQCVNYKLALF